MSMFNPCDLCKRGLCSQCNMPQARYANGKVKRCCEGKGMLEGTQDHGHRLNVNQKAILAVLKNREMEALTVREVEHTLYNNGPLMVSKKGRAWGYHPVQIGLSVLVGKGYAQGFQHGTEPVYQFVEDEPEPSRNLVDMFRGTPK